MKEEEEKGKEEAYYHHMVGEGKTEEKGDKKGYISLFPMAKKIKNQSGKEGG